jgi:lysophospholipase L1-like esterase
MSQSVSTPASISHAVAGDGVLAFGDSIGVGTFRDLATRLGTAGTLLAVNAKGGRPTAPTVDILNEWATTYRLPRRILMAVGSNDIFNPSGFAAQISRVMTIVGPGVTVYWSEIHVSRWSQPVGVQIADQRNSGWLNVQLHAATAKHQNLRVISWASFLAQQPASRIRAYLADGVHTTTAGMAVRNAAITALIQARPR